MRHILRFYNRILTRNSVKGIQHLLRQIGISILILVMSIGVYAQASLELNIQTGSGLSGNPRGLTVFQNELFFGANSSGNALRSYDGTSLTTYETFNGIPDNLIVLGDQLFFRSITSSTGLEPWIFNGTSSTVQDIVSGTGSSSPASFTIYDDKLYFEADGSDGAGDELWVHDGTSFSRVGDIYPGSSNGDPTFLTVYDGKLFFSGTDRTTGVGLGIELYSYDGTTITRETDIMSGGTFGDASPQYMTVYNGKLYFASNYGNFDRELYVYDGTSASLVANINPPVNTSGKSDPENLFVYKNKLYFSADDGTNGRELWSYDGTTTEIVFDINSGGGDSDPDNLYEAAGKLFFTANDGTNGVELWVLDGESDPVLFQDINTGGNSNPEYLVEFQNRLFFQATGSSSVGTELWSADIYDPEITSTEITTVNQGENYTYKVEIEGIGNPNDLDLDLTIPGFLSSKTGLINEFNPMLDAVIQSMASDENGNVYISGLNKIYSFDPTDGSVTEVYDQTTFRTNNGFGSPSNLEVYDDFLYILYEQPAVLVKVQISDGAETILLTESSAVVGETFNPGSIMSTLKADAQGNLYMYDTENFRILRIDNGSSDIHVQVGDGSFTINENVTASSTGMSYVTAISFDEETGAMYYLENGARIRRLKNGSIATVMGANGSAQTVGAQVSAFVKGMAYQNDLLYLLDTDNTGSIKSFEVGGTTITDVRELPSPSAGQRLVETPDGVFYVIDNESDFSAFDSNGLSLIGIPTNDDVGTYSVSIKATFGGVQTSQDYSLQVVNVNDAPGLSPLANTSTVATEDVAYEYLVYANDLDGDLVAMEATTLPDWLSVEQTIETFSFATTVAPSDVVYSNDQFFITGLGDNGIYRVNNLGGSLTRIAGQSDFSSGFVDADGTAASFDAPFALDVDSNGDLYVIDQDNHALRKVSDLDGTVTVTTIAGNGSAGNTTGAVSTSTATFDSPSNILIAPNDDIYIADSGNGVIKLLSGGMLSTLKDGTGADITFTGPYGLAMDNAGVLYVGDNGGHAIYSIDGTTVTLLAGTSGSLGVADGDGGSALFDSPTGMVVSGDGSTLFVAESENETIRKLTIVGATVTVSTISEGQSTPIGMIKNPNTGALLVADIGFGSVTENYPALEFSGTPTNDDLGINEVIASLNDGTSSFDNTLTFYVTNTNDAPVFTSTGPTSTTEDDLFSYTIESEDIDSDALAHIATTLPEWLTMETPEPIVTTVAGNGIDEYSGDDGVATSAGIGTPDAVAVDLQGNLYIAHENYIRKVDTDGNISTIVGDGTAANSGDGDSGVNAQITGINDMHVGPEGNLFISIEGAVRKLSLTGVITTIAGTPGSSGSAGTGDGGTAVSATFNQNSGIYVDLDGNIFIADQSDNVIRKIGTDDNISTVATNVTFVFDIVVDADGNIYAVNDGSTGLLKIDENDVKTDLTTSSSIHFSTMRIAIDNIGNIYGVTSNSPAHQLKVYNIESGEVEVVANDPNSSGFSGDGESALFASFNTLEAVAMGPNGSIYLADGNNSRIRKITTQSPKISGTPTQDVLGDHNVVLEVSDGTLSATQSFTLTVNNLPEIINVSSTDGSYIEGDVLDIIVTFDGDVTSSGSGTSPNIVLETGDTDQIISQSANSETGITFSYTVQGGDTSSDLAYNSSTIEIGDYSIQSPEGVDAVLSLPTSGASGSLSDNQDIIVDTTIPTLTSVSIASDNATTDLAREGDEITLSITSSEDLSADPTVTIAGNNATVTSLTTSTFEATYTMTDNDEEGEVTFNINYSDGAENAGTEVTMTTDESTVTYDTTSPSVVLSASIGEATNDESFELTMTFTTSVTGFTEEDITLTNATASDFNGSDDVYSVTITPLEEGDVLIGVAAEVAQDASGNSNVAATTYETTYDVTAPTVNLSTAATSVNAGFELTITFSETVTGFAEADLTVTNGEASELSGSGTTYTTTITPSSEGGVSINVAAETSNDIAGNTNSAASELSVIYDVTSPKPTLSTEATTTNSEFEVSITFDESVSDFTVDDLTLNNATASEFDGSGTTYTFTLTPEADGEVTATIEAEVAADAAGNINTASNTLTVTYDATAPNATLSSESSGTVTGAFEMEATFSESVSEFTSEDVTVTNGMISGFDGSDGNYTFIITPTEEGAVTVAIAAGVATDAGGNGNIASNNFNIDFVLNDTESPSVTISSEITTTSGAFEVSISFSESVIDFELAHITVVNGSLGNFSGSGSEYSATVTPLEAGAVELSIAAGVTEDAAGNANTASNTLSVTFDGTADTTAPTVSLSTESNSVSGTFDVNIAFSELVTGFELGDITVDNGTAAGLAGSGSAYTVSITPDEAGAVTISIAAAVVEDAAGNENTASSSLSVTFDGTDDTTAPTVTLTTASTEVTEGFEVTITFNEEVTGFESSDISVDNGTLSDFSGNGSGYVVTVTPLATGTVSINIESGVAADAAGNGNESGSLSVEATISETTLSVSFNSNQIKVYPNPSTDFIQIDSSLPVSKYYVFDLQGKVVIEATSETNLIDIRQLREGTYMLKVKTNEGSLSKVFLKR